MINYRRLTAAMMAGLITLFSVTGCAMPWEKTKTVYEDSSSSQASSFVSNVSSTAVTDIEFDAEDLDASYNEADCTKINLNDLSSLNSDAVTYSSSKITITKAGSYLITGSFNGSIEVNTEDKGTVRLILNNASISANDSAAIKVSSAKKVLITLPDGTSNSIKDSSSRSDDESDYSAAFYSKADLVFNGNGSLKIDASYKNGLKTGDQLKIVSGNFEINSKEDALIGKELVGIKNGNFTINTGQDGIKSTYDKDTSKGNIVLLNGTYNITSGNDAVQSENGLYIADGTYNIKTNGGSANAVQKTGDSGFGMPNNQSGFNGERNIGDKTSGSNAGNVTLSDINLNSNSSAVSLDELTRSSSSDTNASIGTFTANTSSGSTSNSDSSSDSSSDSYKGLKASNLITIVGGQYNIDSCDDSLHTNGDMLIKGGTFTISSGDDGMHADNTLQIDGASINITKSYEGIEGLSIIINEGDIKLVASDDGMNTASGSSSGDTFGGNQLFGFKNGMNFGDDSSANNGDNKNNFQMPQMSDNAKTNNGQMPQMPDNANANNGQMPQMNDNSNNSANTDSTTDSSSPSLTINGGNIYVNASGDGLDSNGSMTFNGGYVVVEGPTSSGDTALDFDKSLTFNGGTVIALGSNGMVETPTSATNGACIVAQINGSASEEFSVKDSNGKVILSLVATKSYGAAIVYSADIKTGNTYTLNAGSNSSSVEVSSAVTSSGSLSTMGGGMRGNMNSNKSDQNTQNGQNFQKSAR